MNKLFLMIGIPGAGKSTFLRKKVGENGKVISRDEIRFAKLKEGEDYFAHETEVWNEYVATAKESLKWNKETYLDATHLSKASRLKIINALGVKNKDVELNCIYFNAPLELCLDRNELREGRRYVPREQIKKMYSQLTKPDFEEGFKNIYIYDVKNEKMKVIVEE